MQSARVLVLSGPFKGAERVCLGEDIGGCWAVSPDRSDEILSLALERAFALLVALSGDPLRNYRTLLITARHRLYSLAQIAVL